ncbi:hypothetical protein LEP1GSC170_0047 [Leptospira interrogans serovar Bataviae str. HAI135]|nr:hypothetical protein LEP1GSC170_0047 [Leptospira interrogans serovar Bataviae str. HAI135]
MTCLFKIPNYRNYRKILDPPAPAIPILFAHFWSFIYVACHFLFFSLT